MALTLSNNLTGSTSREVNSMTRNASILGTSMTTGDNKKIPTIDAFLGNSLKDKELMLSALTRNTSYAVNLVKTTSEYLNAIASFIQKGLVTITSVGILSAEKVPTLQQYIDALRSQINVLINTANFDNRQLLNGGATQIKVQLGTSTADNMSIFVRDIGNDNLYRTSLALAINEWIAEDPTAARTSYYSADELKVAQLNNENLISIGGTGYGGSGTGIAMTENEISNALVAIRDRTPNLLLKFDSLLPLLKAQLALANTTLATATTNEFAAAITGPGNANNAKFELFYNNPATSLATADNRMLAHDIFLSALTNIRGEQARLRTQEGNLMENIDVMRATVNITQKTADSYLHTDYLLTAQEYSEVIRRGIAAITALQAANKIPEAAQKLLDNLAR
jgi:flagellin-like hook-associated protein FlgL